MKQRQQQHCTMTRRGRPGPARGLFTPNISRGQARRVELVDFVTVGGLLRVGDGLVEAEHVAEREPLGLGERGDRVLHRVVDDVLDLELVLVVRVRVGQVAELLRQLEAVGHRLGRDEVLGHLDAAVQVPHLVVSRPDS